MAGAWKLGKYFYDEFNKPSAPPNPQKEAEIKELTAEPIFFAVVPRLIPPRLHAYQGPGAMEFLPIQPELQHAMTKGVVRIALRPPDTAVPDQHRPRTVLLGRDDAFEFRIFQRMIFDMHGEAFLARIEAGPFRHGPALQCPVELEPEIIMQARRGMFLHDIDRTIGRGSMSGMAGRLGTFPKVTLPAIPL